MESFFSRYKNALVLLAVLLAQVICLASQMKRADYASRADNKHVRIARAWAAYTITPIEQLLLHTTGGVRGVWSHYVDLRYVKQHDRDLQYQIDQLRLREAAMAEDARQGQRLQRLLAFKQQYVGTTVAAQIVGTGGGDQSRILVLDKGTADGLRSDMAVITPDGIVGKLRDVFAHSAQLLLINDTSSGAGVLVVDTRSRGVVRGNAAGEVVINNLLPDERIKPGQNVITSGGDHVFPRGLTVGAVQSIAPDPDHQPYTLITIRTTANLSRLEEVLVVTNVAQQIAGDTNTNLSDTDASQQKAAEVQADHLPGLQDSKTPGVTGDKPPGADSAAQPGVVLVKPAPTLHADRFTPGAVPPAADLRPGGQHSAVTTMPAPRAKPNAEATREP